MGAVTGAVGAARPHPEPGFRVLAITHGRTGRTLARLAAPAGTRLRLTYTHSIYRQPGLEEFDLDEDGLRLVRLASPSAAVLEYYARPEPVRPGPDGLEIVIEPERHAFLPILASRTGARTVGYGAASVPLTRLVADGEPVHLRVLPDMR